MRWWLLVGFSVLAFLGIYSSKALVLVSSSAPELPLQSQPIFATEKAEQKSEMQQGSQDRQRQAQKQQTSEFQALLARAKESGQGNMQAWLFKYWQACQAMGVENCAKLQADMALYLTEQERQWLARMLENFTHYHEAMTATTQSSNAPLSERLQALSSLRERYFGKDSALLFGDEEALAIFQQGYGDLLQQSPNLALAERLARLEHLQSTLSMSEGKDSVLGADARYQQALALIEDQPKAERTKLAAQFRERFFGDKAQEVERFERHRQEQKDRQLSYAKALERLNQRWEGNTTSAGYQRELKELRLRSF